VFFVRAWRKNRSLVRKIREDAAAQQIQRAARAWLARTLVQRLREEELGSRAIRSAAALNIQVGETRDTYRNPKGIV